MDNPTSENSIVTSEISLIEHSSPSQGDSFDNDQVDTKLISMENTRELVGATASEFPNTKINFEDDLFNAPSDPSDLSMLLWMRGDEDWAGEFNLDADEAMKILGIKRSRLTQLTGKEIRVARKRVDRYIKPFYRRLDLETYLASARASLTVQKSSETLEKASHLFEEKAEGIQSLLKDELSKTFSNIESSMSNITNLFQSSTIAQRDELQRRNLSLQVFFESMSQNTFEEFKSLHSLSHAAIVHLREEQSKSSDSLKQSINSALHATSTQLGEAGKRVEEILNLVRESHLNQESRIQDMAKVLSLLLQYTRDLSQRVNSNSLQAQPKDLQNGRRVNCARYKLVS